MRRWVWLVLAALGAVNVAQAATVSVAAASNLREVLPALIAAYTQQHPGRIDVNYAASGVLVQQILHGAPYHLFLSANDAYAERVAQALSGVSPVCRYARGSLAFWSSTPSSASGWQQDLVAGRWTRVALANPRHAPYGQAAQAILSRWQPSPSTQWVYANNVSQVTQWASQGVIDAGFMPLGLAQQLRTGVSIAVPDALYPPLWQSAVMLPRGKNQPEPRQFMQWLLSYAAAPIWQAQGYRQARGQHACG